MKKEFLSILLIIAIIAMASTAHAGTPVKKLGRGILNTLTGVLEVPITVIQTSASEGYMKGISTGLIKGIVGGLYRTVAGVYEIVTFLIPAPADYAPVTDPELLFEEMVKEDPSMAVEFAPLGSDLHPEPKK